MHSSTSHGGPQWGTMMQQLRSYEQQGVGAPFPPSGGRGGGGGGGGLRGGVRGGGGGSGSALPMPSFWSPNTETSQSQPAPPSYEGLRGGGPPPGSSGMAGNGAGFGPGPGPSAMDASAFGPASLSSSSVMLSPASDPWWKRSWVWILVGVVVLALLLAFVVVPFFRSPAAASASSTGDDDGASDSTGNAQRLSRHVHFAEDSAGRGGGHPGQLSAGGGSQARMPSPAKVQAIEDKIAQSILRKHRVSPDLAQLRARHLIRRMMWEKFGLRMYPNLPPLPSRMNASGAMESDEGGDADEWGSQDDAAAFGEDSDDFHDNDNDNDNDNGGDDNEDDDMDEDQAQEASIEEQMEERGGATFTVDLGDIPTGDRLEVGDTRSTVPAGGGTMVEDYGEEHAAFSERSKAGKSKKKGGARIRTATTADGWASIGADMLNGGNGDGDGDAESGNRNHKPRSNSNRTKTSGSSKKGTSTIGSASNNGSRRPREMEAEETENAISAMLRRREEADRELRNKIRATKGLPPLEDSEDTDEPAPKSKRKNAGSKSGKGDKKRTYMPL